MRCIRPLLHLLSLLTFTGQTLLTLADLYDDYVKCKAFGGFGAENGSSSWVCDPEERLTPQALTQLNGMLADMERDVGCRCPDGCGGKKYAVRLLVINGDHFDQSSETTALNETAERIWNSEEMGTKQCDNGLLMLYIFDQKRMATYQGHQQLQIYSDQDLENLHQLTLHANRSGAAEALSFRSNDSVSQRTGDEQNSAPIIGLSVALALTFFILFSLLVILLVKCCSVCCWRQKRMMTNLDPKMPNYKPIEPIYIVAPNVSDPSAFAPPSGVSLYGTATFPSRAGRSFSPPPLMLFGHAPLPPQGTSSAHLPLSRSATPTSTQRTRRTQNASGDGVAQSMHSTPEPNKRDKIDRTMTVRSNATYYTASNANLSPSDDMMPKKPFAHPQHPSTSTNRDFVDKSFPFLDPKRKQEVQTREEFIS